MKTTINCRCNPELNTLYRAYQTAYKIFSLYLRHSCDTIGIRRDDFTCARNLTENYRFAQRTKLKLEIWGRAQRKAARGVR